MLPTIDAMLPATTMLLDVGPLAVTTLLGLAAGAVVVVAGVWHELRAAAPARDARPVVLTATPHRLAA